MARRAVGLDIGASAIRAAEVSDGRQPTLHRFAQLSLPRGVVREGEVGDAEALSGAVRELWRAGGFREKSVYLGVASPRVVMRPLEMQALPPEEMPEAVKYQAQEFIPIPLEDAVLGYEVLGEAGEGRVRVLVVAAHRSLVLSLVEVVRSAGLRTQGVEFSPLALARAVLLSAGQAEEGADLLLNVGHSLTFVLVVADSRVPFGRTLAMGGEAFTQALAAGLGISREEAEARKLSMAISRPGEPPLEPASRLLEQRAYAFLEEIRTSLEYYQAQPGAVPVKRALVTGGGARLGGFLARLEETLRVPVVPVDVLAGVKVGKVGLTQEQLAEVSAVGGVALGLALGAWA